MRTYPVDAAEAVARPSSRGSTARFDAAAVTIVLIATVTFRNEGRLFDLGKLAVVAVLAFAVLKGLARGCPKDVQVPIGGFALAATTTIALSSIVAISDGIPIQRWSADVLAPFAIATAPFAAAAVADAASIAAVRFSLGLSGLIAAISFATYWRDARGIDASVSAAGLASWYIPLGAATYVAPRDGRHRRPLFGGICAAVLLMPLVLSGSRIAIIPVGTFCLWLVVRPLLVERRAVPRWQGVARAVVAILALWLLASATGIAASSGGARFLSSFDVLSDGLSEDLSFQERRTQTDLAIDALGANPLLGTGPGFVYEWTTPTGRFKQSPVAESPAGLLADYGLLGAAVLATLVVAIATRSFRRLRRRRSALGRPADEALVVVCLAALCNAVVASPFDDKGLALVLILLLALSFAEGDLDAVDHTPMRTNVTLNRSTLATR